MIVVGVGTRIRTAAEAADRDGEPSGVMEFTVTKSDLVRELSLSQGVVEKKTTIPILSNVLVEAEGDRIVMTATDLELGIRCACAAKVGNSGSGTIPAKRLLDYVRLLPDADI